MLSGTKIRSVQELIQWLAGNDFDDAAQDVVAQAVRPAFTGFMGERQFGEVFRELGNRLAFALRAH